MNPLEQAQILFEELNSLRPLSKEDELRIMQKFRLDWNYHSNHLEGNQLTFGETKALLLFNITAQGKPLKDHVEITGHNEAIEWIIEVIKEERSLTENFIRHLHQLLLKEPYETSAITPDGKPTTKKVKVGEYKNTPNHVLTKTGEIFRFATPEETPSKMHDLLEWYKLERGQKEKNPIILASEFHYRFIRIHPFDDGNGRLARLLMNFILMSFGYPPVIIKTEDKENYFSVLQLADAGQIEPFINYIGDNIVHSLKLMIRGAKGEEIEEDNDLEKEIALLANRVKSLGSRVKKPKNKEDIKRFYKNSVGPLFHLFFERLKSFEQFYFDSDLRVWVGNGSSGSGGEQSWLENLTSLDLPNRLDSFRLSYEFRKPVEFKLHDFQHTSSITIHLEDLFIKIPEYKGQEPLNLLYDEDLTKEQIKTLVSREMKFHKKRLEHFINKIEKN